MFFAMNVHTKGIAEDHSAVYLFYQCDANSEGERHGEESCLWRLITG